jgi:hypothetical protein
VVRCWRRRYREKDRAVVRRFLMWYDALSRLGILIPAVVVIAATLGSCAGSADSPSGGGQAGENAGQQAEESGGQPAEPTVAVGQPLTVGNAEWTVTSAYPATQLTSEHGDTKRGNFVVVDFQFKNNSDEGVTVSTESLALFDGNGREFKFDTDTFFYIDSFKNIFLVEVGAGGSQEGEVIFEVAPDASQFQLQLGEANPFSNKKGYVNLGF